MQTHAAKRVEIILEAPMERRFSQVLEDCDVSGYTILPVYGGSGRSGHWTREGQVSRAGGMVCFVVLIREEKVDGLLEATMEVLERHVGVVSITDAEVLRAGHPLPSELNGVSFEVISKREIA